MIIHLYINDKCITVTTNDKSLNIRNLLLLAFENYQNESVESLEHKKLLLDFPDNFIVCHSKTMSVLDYSDIVQNVCKNNDILNVYSMEEMDGYNENLLDGESPTNNGFRSPIPGPLYSLQSIFVQESLSMIDITTNNKSFNDNMPKIDRITKMNESNQSNNNILHYLSIKCSIQKGSNGYGLKICDRDIVFDGVTSNKFIIKSIERNSSADQSCLEHGDIIMEINDLVVVGIPIDALIKIITQTTKSLQLLIQRKLNTNQLSNLNNSNKIKLNFDECSNDQEQMKTNTITINFFINCTNNRPIILINSLNDKTNLNSNMYSNYQVTMINSHSLNDISLRNCLELIDSTKCQPVEIVVSNNIFNLSSNHILKFINKTTFTHLKSIEYSDSIAYNAKTNDNSLISSVSPIINLPDSIVLSKSYDHIKSNQLNSDSDSDITEPIDRLEDDCLENQSNFNRNILNRTSFSSKRLSQIQGSSSSKHSTNIDIPKHSLNNSKSGHNTSINAYNENINYDQENSFKENNNSSSERLLKRVNIDVEPSNMQIIGNSSKNNKSFDVNPKYLKEKTNSSPVTPQPKTKNTSWLSKIFKRKSISDRSSNESNLSRSISSHAPFNEFSVDIKTPPSITSSSKNDHSCDIENGPFVQKSNSITVHLPSNNKQLHNINSNHYINLIKSSHINQKTSNNNSHNSNNAISHNKVMLTRTTSQITYNPSNPNNSNNFKQQTIKNNSTLTGYHNKSFV